jgi:hypothetical protein
MKTYFTAWMRYDGKMVWAFETRDDLDRAIEHYRRVTRSPLSLEEFSKSFEIIELVGKVSRKPKRGELRLMIRVDQIDYFDPKDVNR